MEEKIQLENLKKTSLRILGGHELLVRYCMKIRNQCWAPDQHGCALIFVGWIRIRSRRAKMVQKIEKVKNFML
jgi:hypothetical protein